MDFVLNIFNYVSHCKCEGNCNKTENVKKLSHSLSILYLTRKRLQRILTIKTYNLITLFIPCCIAYFTVTSQGALFFCAAISDVILSFWRMWTSGLTINVQVYDFPPKHFQLVYKCLHPSESKNCVVDISKKIQDSVSRS